MAEKLKMMSGDIIGENIDYIAKKFSNCLKEVKDEEGNLVKRIDFDLLKQELSTIVIDDRQERYQMTWPDKKKSILLANSRINATLRPDKEKSFDFENTKNLYIEGDNLDVLKLLRETYLGKVNMIYIDPPYNTGKDFVYNDNFHQTTDEFSVRSGEYDDQGNRLFLNNDANGRFHTDWLNLIYPRLKIAKDFLSNEGVIFISIDDNEFHNLKKICDEIFDVRNFITCLPRLTSAQRPSQEKFISIQHDYILIYAKSKDASRFAKTVKRTDIEKVQKDEIGLYFEGDTSPILASSTQGYSAGGDYDFEYQGKIYSPIASDGTRRRWLWTTARMEAAAKLGILRPTKNGLRVQNYIDKEFQIKINTMVSKDTNLILASYDFMNSKYANNNGTAALTSLELDFDFAKPVSLLEDLIELIIDKNSIILDFFSGSATTAEATMRLNLKDSGNRKFIMVQLPEEYEYKNDGFRSETLCDLGQERIRRAGQKIKQESIFGQNLDIGFRVLKLDSSNMNDVYYNPGNYSQTLLDSIISNIKEDRTPLDLLFQIMLELGIELSSKIEEKEIAGKKCFIVNENDIVACFDKGITDDVIKELAKIHSIYAVFCDSAFANDSANINCEQIFKSISPSTTIKVI